MSMFRKYPPTFWVANSMEIFERMAWYGFYAVSSLYITGSPETGGLGFTSEQRGIMQGIIPFLLYLFPVVTGALADKFGYKRTFFVAYAIMTPSYWLLGQPDGFWGFFFVFLLVAIGAATFKPVVVGTVSHVTTSETKAMGFGIFYMMVNIGGFAGPLVAGIVRNEMGWPWVFNMSAIWIAFNFVWLLLFYKEPEGRTKGLEEELAEAKRKLADSAGAGSTTAGPGQALGAALRVLPTFIVAGLVINWTGSGIALGAIILLALLLKMLVAIVPEDVRLLLRKTGEDIVEVLGNPAFFIIVIGSIFAVMLAGGEWIGWTQCLILVAVIVVGNLVLDAVLRSRDGTTRVGVWAPARIGDWRFVLYLLLLSGFWTEFNQLFLTMPEYIRDYSDTHDILRWLIGVCSALGLTGWADGIRGWMQAGNQINPEWLVNIDAGAIVLFQVVISAIFAKWKPFTTMIVGTIITGFGLALGAYGDMGWIVAAAIFIFAIGEMMASPKSQEYVARIAPPAKTAMYMGYYFVSIALGNLFGGILSGQMYGHFGRDVKDPVTMWYIFGGIGILTAMLLVLYDRLVARRVPQASGSAMNNIG